MKAPIVKPSRRSFVSASAAGFGLALGLPANATVADALKAPNVAFTGKTYVLVHGSWHGGWCWQRVADRLRAQGHRVFTPSFTGMGDRAHLLSKDITIDTFVQDVAAVISTEELSDVILVGHSFGGVAISGVADRMRAKISHLVYLDSVILESGQTAFSVYPQKEVEERIAASNKANGGLAVPNPKTLPSAWGFQEGTPDYAWMTRRITPTPLRAYMTALDLHGPVGAGLPRTYIHCVKPANPVIDKSAALVKSWPGWNMIEFSGPHDSMITQPDAITTLLLQV